MVSDQNRFLSVNWVDGMSINKNHFIDQDNFQTQQHMDLNQLIAGPYGYGIRPAMQKDAKEPQISFNLENNLQATLKLNHFRAITPGGAAIDITPSTTGELELACPLPETPEGTQNYLAVLTANPFKRTPWGLANPEEVPPRKPSVTPHYQFHLMEEPEDIDSEIGLFHLAIGRLHHTGEAWEVDTTYIPPCTATAAHPALISTHREFEKQLHNIERHAVQIVQKVRGKHQENTLATAISFVCQQLLPILGTALSTYRQFVPHQAPIKMIEPVMNMARIIKNALDSWQGHGKDELMTYLSEWCNLKQGDLEDAIQQLITLEYRHTDIAKSLNMANHLLQITASVFNVLVGLDFIGKRTETDLFVKEESDEEEPEGTTQRRRGFLRRRG